MGPFFGRAVSGEAPALFSSIDPRIPEPIADFEALLDMRPAVTNFYGLAAAFDILLDNKSVGFLFLSYNQV